MNASTGAVVDDDGEIVDKGLLTLLNCFVE